MITSTTSRLSRAARSPAGCCGRGACWCPCRAFPARPPRAGSAAPAAALGRGRADRDLAVAFGRQRDHGRMRRHVDRPRLCPRTASSARRSCRIGLRRSPWLCPREDEADLAFAGLAVSGPVRPSADRPRSRHRSSRRSGVTDARGLGVRARRWTRRFGIVLRPFLTVAELGEPGSVSLLQLRNAPLGVGQRVGLLRILLGLHDHPAGIARQRLEDRGDNRPCRRPARCRRLRRTASRKLQSSAVRLAPSRPRARPWHGNG